MVRKIYSLKLPEEMGRQHLVDALSRARDSLDSLVSIFSTFITSGNTPRGWLIIEDKVGTADSQISWASLEIRGVVSTDGALHCKGNCKGSRREDLGRVRRRGKREQVYFYSASFCDKRKWLR